MSISRLRIASAVAAAAAVFTTGALADSVSDFYKGKTVTVYVGVSPGGIYSTAALMLSRHMSGHLAGAPTMVVQHMPGAGGTKMVNYVYNVAPRDGTAVMTPNSGIDKRALFNIGNPKYDPVKINWLGGWGEPINTLSVRSDSPAKTFQELTTKEIVIGAIGKTSSTYMIPALMNNVLGTKLKIITGYRGGNPIRAAMEKGEVHGWAGQWLGWKLAKPDWVRDGKLIHLVQMASARALDLPNVPLLSDFARNDEERAMFTFVQTNLADRALAAPPDVPADRLAALARAYQATLRDPAFVTEAKKHKFDIHPVSGERIQQFIAATMSMPEARVKKLAQAMGLKM